MGPYRYCITPSFPSWELCRAGVFTLAPGLAPLGPPGPRLLEALPSGRRLLEGLGKPPCLIARWHYCLPFAYGLDLNCRCREPYIPPLLFLEPRSCLLYTTPPARHI
jgi:hypothetical protein